MNKFNIGDKVHHDLYGECEVLNVRIFDKRYDLKMLSTDTKLSIIPENQLTIIETPQGDGHIPTHDAGVIHSVGSTWVGLEETTPINDIDYKQAYEDNLELIDNLKQQINCLEELIFLKACIEE